MMDLPPRRDPQIPHQTDAVPSGGSEPALPASLSTSELAECYRLALMLELIGVRHVVAWAETVLMSAAVPDRAIAGLASADNLPSWEVNARLMMLAGERRSETAANVMLGVLAVNVQNGILTHRHAANMLGELRHNWILPDNDHIISRISSYFSNAADGYIDEGIAVTELNTFLEPFLPFAKLAGSHLLIGEPKDSVGGPS